MPPGTDTSKYPAPNTARRDRYEALRLLWRKSSLPRVRSCRLSAAGTGRDPATGRVGKSDGFVYLVRTPTKDGYRGGLSGLQTCGSTWSCPVCSERIQANRQAEVTDALNEAHRRGWTVGFVTLTVRHSRGDSLDRVWKAVNAGWRSVTSGNKREWQADRDRFGIVGYLRLVEVTHGVNGWHVHVHALVFLDPAKAQLDDLVEGPNRRVRLRHVEEFGAHALDRWKRGVQSVGKGFKPSVRRGLDVRLVTTDNNLGQYFAKGVYHVKSVGSTAHDVTGSATKHAKHGNVTPFGLLARYLDGKGRRDLELWQEYERVSKGKRQLLWSQGMRADLLPDVEERTDEQIADDDSLAGDPVARIASPMLRRLAKAGAIPYLLDALELDDDLHDLHRVLNGLRIPWDPVSVVDRDTRGPRGRRELAGQPGLS